MVQTIESVNGIINGFLKDTFGFTHDFFGTATSARITVIIINIDNSIFLVLFSISLYKHLHKIWGLTIWLPMQRLKEWEEAITKKV